jgi:chromosomal replication initiation ATPase DnaA
MKNRLSSIGMNINKQVDMLKLIHMHVADLAKGSKVSSISPEAQNQIKGLFKLSQSQYVNLAQTHILKGLAAPNINLRFQDVGVAHHDTFQWLFAQQDTPNLSASIDEDEQSKAGVTTDEGTTTDSEPQEWSVWQLDDGYEEQNQDWWYKRDETMVNFVAAPEHQHLLEAGGRFIEWLSSGVGIFHISGKLGSGKSTLMKYLFNHPRTETELSKWAGAF